jgi:Predicted dehydrogenase
LGEYAVGELNKVREDINSRVNKDIECSEWHNSIVLEGTADSYDGVVAAGLLAANRGYKGVVNKISVRGIPYKPIKVPQLCDRTLDGKRVDVLIIGGGITGCAIARELSKWDISILLIDKEEDLAMHASSRNDGMVHPGIEPKVGSRKAYFNVRGNKLYSKVTKELGVPFRRSGSMVLYNKKWMRLLLPYFYYKAGKNGVEGLRNLSADEVRKREPHVRGDIAGALFLPTTGVVSPYKMTVAYAENAVLNGGEVSLNTAALSMERSNGRIISVKTNRGVIYPDIVINAAGVYSDIIADIAGDGFFTIHPRKGELVFLDKKKGILLNSVVAMPDVGTIKSNTKGGGVVKTIDGNILVGPDAYEVPCREEFSTNRSHIEGILKRHLPLIPGLSPSDVITYCAGIRAATYEEDFIVEPSEYVKNLIHAAGIQSPGLASAPAIAEEIERLAVKMLSNIKEVKPKPDWNPYRKGIPDVHSMETRERNDLIKKRPEYGIVVCRCEEISMGEIIDAIKSPIPVHTVDGIKRRVRAGMGRCQGGFCMPRIIDILKDNTGLDMLSITKKGGTSYLLKDETKKAGGSGECGDK